MMHVPKHGAALAVLLTLAVLQAACTSPAREPEPTPAAPAATPAPATPAPAAPDSPAPPEPESPPEPTAAPTAEAEPAPADPLAPPPLMSVPTEADTIVLVRVDGQPLSLQEALDTYEGSHGGHGVLVRGEAAVRELAARLAEERVFYQEATALGLTEDPDLEEAAEDFRLDKAAELFWERELAENAQVSDQEVEDFYAGTQVAVTVDLIEVETRELAEELRARAAAGEDFGDLAEEHSIHESRDFGGRLPFLRRGTLPPDLEGVAFALREPGELSPVIESAGVFALLRLEERVENAEAMPREMALPRIRDILEEKARQDRRAELEAEFAAAAGLEVEEALLTRGTIVGETPDDTVLARSVGESFTVGEARRQLDLDAVRAATAEEFDPAMVELVEQWGARESLRLAMERRGLLSDPEVLREVRNYRRDAALALLHERFVYEGVQIDEEDVRRYYQEHLEDEFTQEPEVRLAYMVLDSEESTQLALERLEAGESFGVVARELSVDPSSKAHGGRMGWITPGRILPEVEAVAFEMQPGSRSGPIETPVGTFLVEVLERKDAQPLSFETVFVHARRGAAKEARRAARDRWAQRLSERAAVEFDEEGVARAVAFLEARAEADAAAQAEAPEPEGPSFHGGGS